MEKSLRELLLKDLCSRLPYGIKAQLDYGEDIITVGDVSLGILHDIVFDAIKCKPYLRPMESMTEEEKKEFTKVLVKSQECSYENNESATTIVNDWYLSKGFDVRGLIPMGLALEAPEDMYK